MDANAARVLHRRRALTAIDMHAALRIVRPTLFCCTGGVSQSLAWNFFAASWRSIRAQNASASMKGRQSWRSARDESMTSWYMPSCPSAPNPLILSP